jgi:hypothetical protein
LAIIVHYYTHSFLGKIYWYTFLPLHGLIFNNLIRQIEERS